MKTAVRIATCALLIVAALGTGSGDEHNGLEEKEGCYLQSTKYVADSNDLIATYPLVTLVLDHPSLCHAKCYHDDHCAYWTFKDNLLLGYCKLYKSVTKTKFIDAEFTSGPKFCTDAPTPNPTDAPTPQPTDAPTTPKPTSAPTDEEDALECIAEGIEYKGGKTLATKRAVANVLACRSECLTYDECEAFTWKDNGDCLLKRKGFKVKPSDRFMSGPRVCPTNVECVQQFLEFVGGQTLHVVQDVETAVDCALECKKLASCETWSYRSDKLQCFLRRDCKPSPKKRNSYFFTGQKALCESLTIVPTPSPTLSPLAEVPSCTAKAVDLTFVLDGSGSIKSNEWNLIQKFVRQVSSAFHLGTGESDSRISLIEFATDAWPVWDFEDDEATDHDLFNHAVEDVEDTNSGTATGAAVLAAKELFWDTPVRAGLHKRVVVFVTDGRPNKNTACKANGLPGNPKKCTAEATPILQRGPDKTAGTDDDVFFVFVRVGTRSKGNLFGNHEDLRIDAYPDVIADYAAYIINAICDLE